MIVTCNFYLFCYNKLDKTLTTRQWKAAFILHGIELERC